MTASRRFAATLAADVAGYSQLIEADEQGALGRRRVLRGEPIDPKIDGNRGRNFKAAGVALLAVSPALSTRSAVREHCGWRAARVDDQPRGVGVFHFSPGNRA